MGILTLHTQLKEMHQYFDVEACDINFNKGEKGSGHRDSFK